MTIISVRKGYYEKQSFVWSNYYVDCFVDRI